MNKHRFPVEAMFFCVYGVPTGPGAGKLATALHLGRISFMFE
jgi:hypothetical protein